MKLFKRKSYYPNFVKKKVMLDAVSVYKQYLIDRQHKTNQDPRFFNEMMDVLYEVKKEIENGKTSW